MSLAKGTVSVKAKGQVFGVDECRVEKKLNESWDKAYISCDGYSLPLELNDRVTISFMRPGYSEIQKFQGYVNKIENRNREKSFRQELELFGDGAKTAYTSFQAPSKTIVVSQLIQAMMAKCGLPSNVVGLDNTIVLDSTSFKSVEDYLRDLVTRHSVSFFWDGPILVAFKGTYSTYNFSPTNFVIRETAEDLTNVFNTITLYTDEYYVGSKDYATENNIDRWQCKYFFFDTYYDDKKWDWQNVYSLSACNVAAEGNYSASICFGYYEQIPQLFTAYLRVTFPPTKICDLRYFKILMALRLGGPSEVESKAKANLYFYFYKSSNTILPVWRGSPSERCMKESYTKIWANTIHWDTIAFSFVRGLTNEGIDPSSEEVVDALGIWIWADLTNVMGGYTLDLFLDGLGIQKINVFRYSDPTSVSKWGLREKPSASIAAYTDEDFVRRAQEILRDKLEPERSVRNLEFPGSVDFKPGYGITIAFPDYTKTYLIQEVTDEFDGKDWRTVLRLAGSEVSVPKTDVIGKIKDIDRKVSELDYISRGSLIIGFNAGSGIGETKYLNVNFMDVKAIGSISEIYYIGTFNARSIGNIEKIDNIGFFNASHVGNIGTIDSIENISTMNVDRIGQINKIDNVGSANFNWIYNISNIGTIGNVSTMNVDRIGNIQKIDKIGVMSADVVNSFGTINTIGIACIGIANISQLGGVNKVTTNYLTVNNIATITTATITTAYITKVDSIDTLNADKIFITSASIGAITNTISNFNAISANIGTVNAIGELVALNANVTVNGSLDIPVGTVHVYNVVCDAFTLEAGSIRNMLVGTISGTSINFQVGTITSFMIGTISGQQINIHFGDIDEAVIDHIQGTVNIDILGTVQTVNAGFVNVGTVNIKGGTLSNIFISSGSMGTVSLYSGTITKLELTAPLIGKGVIRAENLSFLPANYMPNPSFEYVDENGNLLDWDTNVARVPGGKEGDYAGLVDTGVYAWSKVTIPTREGEIWSASGFVKAGPLIGGRIVAKVLDSSNSPITTLWTGYGGGKTDWVRITPLKATVPAGGNYIVPGLYASQQPATFDALEFYKGVGSINIGDGVIDTPHLKANCVTTEKLQFDRVDDDSSITKEGALYYHNLADELRFIGQGGKKGYIPRYPLGVEAAPPENLVPNPSFEKDINGDNIPDWWYDVGWGGRQYVRIATDSYKGGFCEELRTTVPGDVAAVLYSNHIPVEPGKVYYCSVHAKKVGGKGGLDFHLDAQDRGKQHVTFLYPRGAVALPTDWTKVDGIVTIPTEVYYVQVGLKTWSDGSNVSTIRVDNVIFSEMRAATSTLAAVTGWYISALENVENIPHTVWVGTQNSFQVTFSGEEALFVVPFVIMGFTYSGTAFDVIKCRVRLVDVTDGTIYPSQGGVLNLVRTSSAVGSSGFSLFTIRKNVYNHYFKPEFFYDLGPLVTSASMRIYIGLSMWGHDFHYHR